MFYVTDRGSGDSLGELFHVAFPSTPSATRRERGTRADEWIERIVRAPAHTSGGCQAFFVGIKVVPVSLTIRRK